MRLELDDLENKCVVSIEDPSLQRRPDYVLYNKRLFAFDSTNRRYTKIDLTEKAGDCYHLATKDPTSQVVSVASGMDAAEAASCADAPVDKPSEVQSSLRGTGIREDGAGKEVSGEGGDKG